jgi:hypothetical protein
VRWDGRSGGRSETADFRRRSRPFLPSISPLLEAKRGLSASVGTIREASLPAAASTPRRCVHTRVVALSGDVSTGGATPPSCPAISRQTPPVSGGYSGRAAQRMQLVVAAAAVSEPPCPAPASVESPPLPSPIQCRDGEHPSAARLAQMDGGRSPPSQRQGAPRDIRQALR